MFYCIMYNYGQWPLCKIFTKEISTETKNNINAKKSWDQFEQKGLDMLIFYIYESEKHWKSTAAELNKESTSHAFGVLLTQSFHLVNLLLFVFVGWYNRIMCLALTFGTALMERVFGATLGTCFHNLPRCCLKHVWNIDLF